MSKKATSDKMLEKRVHNSYLLC